MPDRNELLGGDTKVIPIVPAVSTAADVGGYVARGRSSVRQRGAGVEEGGVDVPSEKAFRGSGVGGGVGGDGGGGGEDGKTPTVRDAGEDVALDRGSLCARNGDGDGGGGGDGDDDGDDDDDGGNPGDVGDGEDDADDDVCGNGGDGVDAEVSGDDIAAERSLGSRDKGDDGAEGGQGRNFELAAAARTSLCYDEGEANRLFRNVGTGGGEWGGGVIRCRHHRRSEHQPDVTVRAKRLTVTFLATKMYST